MQKVLAVRPKGFLKIRIIFLQIPVPLYKKTLIYKNLKKYDPV